MFYKNKRLYSYRFIKCYWQKMIKRKVYLEKVKKYIDTEVVKVITWMRRCWKTYFMRQIMDWLVFEKWIEKENIIYIDKESLKFDFIKNYEDLYQYIEGQINWKKWKIYIFIDEIQDILQWEKTIRNYAGNKRFDIYITGSNSNLLSWELASYLTWRYVEFNLYPLNFNEFLEFRKVSLNDKQRIKEEFRNYLKYWGLPAIHRMEFDDDLIFSYISGVFNSILFKDIVSRYHIRNSSLLVDVFKFLADNTWNIVSSKKIVDYLKKEKISLSLDTLREYLLYFETSFLLNKVKRYDLKWKKLLDLYEKYYLGDLSFRNYLLWFRNQDIAQYLENVVYLELLNRGYEIYIWKIGDLEVDFIAKKAWIVEYFQVTYLLAEETSIKREFWVFEKIKDNYPKTVLSMDEFFPEDYNWIKRKNIIDWLLE